MGKEAMIFSRRLKHYMEKAGKDQVHLIHDLGLNKSTISTWCNGKKLPRMSSIQILADYFGVLKSDLLEEKPAAPAGSPRAKNEELVQLLMQLDPQEAQRVRDFVAGILSSR
jgi:transcriptional regulator with XRE-family HTH domain